VHCTKENATNTKYTTNVKLTVIIRSGRDRRYDPLPFKRRLVLALPQQLALLDNNWILLLLLLVLVVEPLDLFLDPPDVLLLLLLQVLLLRLLLLLLLLLVMVELGLMLLEQATGPKVGVAVPAGAGCGGVDARRRQRVNIVLEGRPRVELALLDRGHVLAELDEGHPLPGFGFLVRITPWRITDSFVPGGGWEPMLTTARALLD
jgi:hypothetical protein